MARLRCWLSWCAAVLAAMILAASPARADCSLKDIWNAVTGTITATKTCFSLCAGGNEAGCYAAAYLDVVLFMIAASGSDTGKGQEIVNEFCSQAPAKAKEIADKTKIGAKIADLLKQVDPSIKDSVLGELAEVLNSVAAAETVLKCSCETEQGTAGLGTEIAICIEAGICAVEELLGGSCPTCDRLPASQAQCAAINKTCETIPVRKWKEHPECKNIGAGSITSFSKDGSYLSQTYREDWAATVTTTSEGTLATYYPSSNACNQGIRWCACPAPMVPKWVWYGDTSGGYHEYTFACNCPEGAHPGALLPSGISECICDDTNIRADFNSLLGMCPGKACPPGQTRLGGDKTKPCVTPCSDPTQGMGFDGTCCNPAQMTTCGKCCPAGTIPNAGTGACEKPPGPVK
jgi:hypothetical protein